MNIVNKLTLRNLRLNRKRTLVTIIGVIISAAMITAVSTFAISFMDLMQRSVIATDGDWHLLVRDLPQEELGKMEEKLEPKDQLLLSKDVGWAALTHSPDPQHKPYLMVRSYNAQGFENYKIELIEGRMPQNDNEIVITEDLKRASPLFGVGNTLSADLARRVIQSSQTDENGDPIEYDDPGIYEPYYQNSDPGGQRERLEPIGVHKDYTIVGVVKEPDWIYSNSAAYLAFTDLNPDSLAAGETLNAAVRFSKIDSSIYDRGMAIGKAVDLDAEFHNALLGYYGVFGNDGIQDSLYTVAGIVIVIIMVGSISLIYNAFAISVSERSRQLGMLASVGATKKQKRGSVFFEGAVIGAISIPLGILSGLAGMAVTFFCINPMLQNLFSGSQKLLVRVSWASILAAVLFSVITIFISTWIPARRASKITPVEAIRQTYDIDVRGKDVKTSKVTRKIFGFEAELGLKNLKRNRRRYKATIFSLIISVVLFLTVATFTGILQKVYSFTQDGPNYDMQVSCYYGDKSDVSVFLDQLSKQEKIASYSQSDLQDYVTYLDEKQAAPYVKNTMEAEDDGSYAYDVHMISLDDASLAAYAKDCGVPLEELTDPNHPAAIVVGTIQYTDQEQGKKVEERILVANPGETLGLSFDVADYSQMTGEESVEPQMQQIGEITIAGLTNQLPIGAYNTGRTTYLQVIVSESVFDAVRDMVPEPVRPDRVTIAFMNSSDPMGLQEDVEELSEKTSTAANITNLFERRQQGENLQLIISVFAYGFVVLIVAICVANIFNTISTSISLRRREFAMLQSVGMTPKGFNRMIRFESIFYGLKALLYGLPISGAAILAMNAALTSGFRLDLIIPWSSVLIVVVGVFLVVGMTMLYSGRKVKKENIIDSLKMENI
ncbi:FtsX-like permease family protein [Zongyangia hominis]|uniref:FtsX-like permease family protein n=1 Tax=Zongyangia hominis TaxID=2763677 RepID=A0A926ED52_9FIRM|nr:FtsX-like permease family protein [Zongyangia hominis]MBC8570878.1 FtsX-like permease family protein [Zongyangia hominis]